MLATSMTWVTGLLVSTWLTAQGPECQIDESVVRVPELNEGSGVASSRRSPGRLWTHNDSGQPVLYALDDKGSVVGRLTLNGARVEDWEAIAVGPCPAGSCIFVGDIGDNDAERSTITVYRVPEPESATATLNVTDVFHARYPDGAHDAETLLVTPQGELLIVTKGDTGPVALYRFPKLAPGATVQLERVGDVRDRGKVAAEERITDGAVSSSGEWVALRTSHAVTLHRASDLLNGNWREHKRIPVERLAEPQGEGVAFADDRTIYLVGEGEGKAKPGTFGRMTCAP